VVAGRAEARLSRSGADKERERARLQSDLDQARINLERTDARLADELFVNRAPASVVDAARARADELRELIARLSDLLGT
jgi:valyl-tRNA synthetase